VSEKGGLLEVISSLRKIVNHPDLFYAYYTKTKSLNKNKQLSIQADLKHNPVLRSLNLDENKGF